MKYLVSLCILLTASLGFSVPAQDTRSVPHKDPLGWSWNVNNCKAQDTDTDCLNTPDTRYPVKNSYIHLERIFGNTAILTVLMDDDKQMHHFSAHIMEEGTDGQTGRPFVQAVFLDDKGKPDTHRMKQIELRLVRTQDDTTSTETCKTLVHKLSRERIHRQDDLEAVCSTDQGSIVYWRICTLALNTRDCPARGFFPPDDSQGTGSGGDGSGH